MRTIMIGTFVSAALLCAAIAEAQTQGGAAYAGPAASSTRNGPTQPAAANGDESAAPPQEPPPGTGAARGSLSHELSRSGGVIQPPPSADRGVVSPPNQGTSRTSVIPPPGTPGGNPLVQPK
jgi:hypothetical protein